jgi:hypothetical protein
MTPPEFFDPDDDETEETSPPLGAFPERDLLRKDLRELARSLTIPQVRYVVDCYYQWQRFRIAAGNQVAALSKAAEPHAVIQWTQGRQLALEKDVQAVLDAYSLSEPSGMGRWARGVCGVGPVLASGLVAHIDITRSPTVGHIWAFAGLDPTRKWEPGTKRPWNASLKVLCWKLGQSFVKVQGRPADVYGKVYAARKRLEQERNAEGRFADQAAVALKRLKREDTVARTHYQDGKLPPGHIDARARRYAVKAFLADYHGVAYEKHYGKPPPLPYPIAQLGHVHLIDRHGVYARGEEAVATGGE